jgi:alpha-galactosidase
VVSGHVRRALGGEWVGAAWLVGAVLTACVAAAPPPFTSISSSSSSPSAVATLVVPGTVLVQREDAFIAAEGQDRAWTIGNGQIVYTVGFDGTGRLVAQDLKSGLAGQSWNPARQVDAVFAVDGRTLSLNRSEVGGFALTRSSAGETGSGIELRLVFTNARDGLRATRVYAVYPGTPIIETWVTFESTTSRVVALSNLASLQLVVDGSNVTWVRGLEAPEAAGGGFTIEKRALGSGEKIAIEATGRSTQSALPLFALRSTQGTFFGGYIWSGSWHFDLIGQPSQRLEATLGLGDTSTVASSGHAVDLPHAVFGVVSGDQADVSLALHRFIVSGLRQGRPFSPFVTYNSWFVQGTRIDEDTIAGQMQAAAEAGVELFQVDAGWYEGAGELDAFDFSSGLGSWRVDREKFPDGLRPLGNRAHQLGMKLGVWVEPERVDVRLLGRAGMPREEWLAQSDGSYQPGVPNAEARTAQLDLGVHEARLWILDRLTTLIEEQGVDYLKWDNNFWINNNRPRAGRGARDGNFEHVQGLYIVLAELRARFPDLIIENCSGGGNRIDLGMMRYTDVGWMDDRTSPSAHVRHNLQGLSTFLPPAYLLSYVIGHSDEPMHGAPDMKMYARSRMPGVLGLSFRADELEEDDMAAIRSETDLWKANREIESTAGAVLLTDQASGPRFPAWDALALVSPARDRALVYAYQNDPGSAHVTLVLRGLDPQSTYELRSLDTGSLGTATGATLMSRGVDLPASPDSASQVLQLLPAAPTIEESAGRR